MAEGPAAGARPVLVLFAPADEAFVRGFLLPALGPSAHDQPVVDARDLATAEIATLDEALLAGGVAIAVITPAFLTNPWSRQSEVLASGAAIDGKLELIPLVLEDCTLPPHIRYKVKLDFQRRDRWEHEADHLRTYLSRPRPVEPPLPCPYPGMRPFQAADARYFFGRSAEIDAVIGLVSAGEPEIYLVGPSGSGKSSLIGAGVLPRLAAQAGGVEPVLRTMRPGDAPLRRLAECIEAGAGAPDAAAVAAWSARHPGARLIVFVDQLEELFTQSPPADQAGFAAALAVLRAEPRCLLLLALRADFYAELLQSQLWLDGRRRHVDLPPLRGPALREAIERPARALEVYFEPGLIDRLLADAAGEPGALPLLQETLVQLWGQRSERLITRAAYEALGEGGRSGLAVAVSSRADRCLRDMTPAQAVIARRALLRLVSFGDGRPNTRRRQTRAQLAAGERPAEFDAVLQQLVAARLVTMDGDDRSGGAQVDLCHEVLITAWPSFAGWVEMRRADEQRRRQIQASAEEWIARGRGASGLLDDGELASALAWRRTDAAVELGESPEVSALIDASAGALSRARAGRRRVLAGVFAGLAVFAAVTATLAVIARRQAGVAEAQRADAEHQRAEAEHQRAEAEVQRRTAVRMLGEQYREAGRQAVAAGRFQRAIPYLVAARDQGVDDAGLRSLFHTATANAVAIALQRDQPVTAVGLDDAAARLVTASGKAARVWDAASGAPVTPPLVHARPVVEAGLRGDGTRVVTVTEDSTAWIWEVSANPPPPVALHHAGRINTASFSTDGELVVTASDDRTARLWNARTGQPAGPPLVHGAHVWSAALSRDGSRIVTTVDQGTSSGIWNAKTGARVAALEDDPMAPAGPGGRRAHLSLVSSAAFSADGQRIVTASTDHTALIWDAITGKPVAPPLKHDDQVEQAAFSPDGARVATVEHGGRVRLWDAGTGALAGPVLDARALRVWYSRDGTRLVAACGDKIVRIWDAASAAELAEIELESGFADVAINRDATRVATASFDGARIWSVGAAPPRVLDPEHHAFDAAFSPDGTRIATTDGSGGLRMWTAAGALLNRQYPGVGAADVVFDRSGRRFAVVGLDGTVEVGDTATATLLPFHRVRGKNPTGGPDSPDRIIGQMPARGAFSPDGRYFATIAGTRVAGIWDIESGRPATPPLAHDGAVLMARWSPDGRRLITASEDGTARLWDAATGAPIGAPLRHPGASWVTAALFSPDGTRIVTLCSDDNVRVWDAGGQLRAVLTGHTGYIIAAAFSPDGALLLTNSDDNSARIWNLATGQLAVPALEHADQVSGAAFSPDGARVVTASGKLVQLWDVRTGRPLGPPRVQLRFARTAKFSPDGRSLLAVGSDDVELWDAGLDARSLDDWHRLARDNSFPQLGQVVDRGAPAAPAAR